MQSLKAISSVHLLGTEQKYIKYVAYNDYDEGAMTILYFMASKKLLCDAHLPQF